MTYVTASANRELDEILDLIGFVLQLTRPQFEDAESKYHAVSQWLNAENSPLRLFFPEIYAQGSMRLDTTLRPLSYTEFDLDLVCEMTIRGVTPLQVYNLLLDRIRSNGRYADIIRIKPRCIRLDYAGQFHLDIIPAIPDPNCPPGDTCILVPDREKKTWQPSNPIGYARWLDVQSAKRRLREKAARLSANANVEPLREPAPAYIKPPLKLAVQLFKRWRDVAFCGREHLAPSSIVLTTLSGILYDGEDHPTDALVAILDGVYRWSLRVDQIELRNPTNDKERITDRWKEKPEMYDAFIEAVTDFRVAWHKLIEHGRYPHFIDDLKDMFEELPVARAITKFAERRKQASGGGNLLMEKATGILSVAAAPAVAPGFIKGKSHTFHGE
jgi:hypothetical protein